MVKKLVLGLTLVGFTATLLAADVFTGTWKLNVAKSKNRSGYGSEGSHCCGRRAGRQSGDHGNRVIGCAARNGSVTRRGAFMPTPSQALASSLMRPAPKRMAVG